MNPSINKFFTRPKNILANDSNIYLVLNTVILIVILGLAPLIPLFFFSGYTLLATLGIVNVLIWILIWGVNRRGNHLLATIIVCIAVYLSAIFHILYIGWYAGFQYHLIAVMVLLLLYPNKNLLIPVFCTSLILLSFLILYYLTRDLSAHHSSFITNLHTYNATITIFAMAATTLFFRINTVKLINKLQYTANTDPLTSLLNRRRMNIELAQHRKMIQRYDQHNSLILLDIDYFKKVNDQYGHGGGDEILKQFSKLLKEGLRETDIVSRWGGEEFLILTPSTDIKNAGRTAEKLRKLVEGYTFDVISQKAHITITCGVAELQPGKPIEESLRQADKLLYQGKDSGRNRVMVQKNQNN